MKKCTAAGENHSDDLVSVYTGLAEPTIMCGFHAAKRHPSVGRIWHRNERKEK